MKSSFKILLLLLIVPFALFSCSSSKSVSTAPRNDRDGQAVEAAAATEGRDGASFEKSIVVNSIGEEYRWVQVKYPGAKVQMQGLVFDNSKPYDVLTFVTSSGEKKEAYFDISKFYGKSF